MMDIERRESELRREIERAEDQLGRALHQLKDATLRRVDLRARVADDPMRWLGAAFALGLWMGSRHG